jgi:hypothetical protein
MKKLAFILVTFCFRVCHEQQARRSKYTIDWKSASTVTGLFNS